MAAALKSILRPCLAALAFTAALCGAAAANAEEVWVARGDDASFSEQSLSLSMDAPRNAWGLRGWSRLGLTATRPIFDSRPIAVSRADMLLDNSSAAHPAVRAA